MTQLQRAIGVLLIAFLITSSLSAQEEGGNILPLSIEEFTRLSLENSFRSQLAEENLATSRWSWQAGQRQLTWPRLDATSDFSRTVTDDDVGTETKTNTAIAGVTVTKPFLTGADVQVAGNWVKSDSDILYYDTPSTARLLEAPAVSASVSQPLYLFVRNSTRRGWESNDVNWENSNEFYRQDRLNIEYDARSIYIGLLVLSGVVELEERTYDSSQKLLSMAKARVDGGTLPSVEYSRADVYSKQSFRLIQNAKTNLEQGLNEARDFASLSQTQRVDLTSRLAYDPLVMELPELMKLALKKNPIVRISDNNIRLAGLNLEMAREGTRPQFNVTGSYSRVLDKSDPADTVIPTSWGAHLRMNWPIFDASQSSLQAKQSEASLRNANRTYSNQIRQLNVSVENAYLDVKRVEGQIADVEIQKTVAEKNLTALQKQFQKGVSNLTDVFESQDNLRSLELEYLQLLAECNRSRDRLKTLVGTDVR